jgi:hypothetical protein
MSRQHHAAVQAGSGKLPADLKQPLAARPRDAPGDATPPLPPPIPGPAPAAWRLTCAICERRPVLVAAVPADQAGVPLVASTAAAPGLSELRTADCTSRVAWGRAGEHGRAGGQAGGRSPVKLHRH